MSATPAPVEVDLAEQSVGRGWGMVRVDHGLTRARQALPYTKR